MFLLIIRGEDKLLGTKFIILYQTLSFFVNILFVNKIILAGYF